MRLPKLSLAGVLLVAVSSLAGCVQLPSVRALPDNLPAQRLFPLASDQCGCLVFRKNSSLSDAIVVFTATSVAGRVLFGNREYDLPHRSRTNTDRGYVNVYSAEQTTVSLATTEVPYQAACSTYPDQPPHGSCFVGTMTLRANGQESTLPVVQLCGC